MFKQVSMADVIKEHVHFKTLPTGWLSGKCPICNDYKPRGGFKFEQGLITYNCWNCPISASYEEFSGKISRKMRKILNAFDIDDNEINAIVNSAFFSKDGKQEDSISIKSLTQVNTTTPEIKLPNETFLLGATNDFLDLQIKICEYLVDRNIDLIKYKFYFSPNDYFNDRVIIPYYRANKLIYWQARAINNNIQPKYKNCTTSREAVMYNTDKLFEYSHLPLFVTEGVFDAMIFDSVCLVGSSLNPAKIELLSKSKRKLVFVIDKDKNGKHLAETALANGWSVTFTPDGTTDINHSVKRFGKTYTAQMLYANIKNDLKSAQLLINFNCK